MKKIGVFASGTGSNFEAIAKACRDGIIDGEIAILICDKPDALVVSKAKSYEVDVFTFIAKDYENKKSYEEDILIQLRNHNIELIALAGYMRLVGETLLGAYEERIVNIHPSLLPEFPGINSIERAFVNGVKETGVTVHYVDSGIDTGAIIAQRIVPVEKRDTLETLEGKIHQVEHELYVDVLVKLCQK
jgi:phosphoribosylglycinamide formyltransferase-1